MGPWLLVFRLITRCRSGETFPPLVVCHFASQINILLKLLLWEKKVVCWLFFSSD